MDRATTINKRTKITIDVQTSQAIRLDDAAIYMRL